jgi:hypothetical protein
MHEVLGLLEEDPDNLPRHRLEHIWGFLVYVTRTHPCMVSYLIGLHMTIDSWRGNQDGDGWRLSTQDLKMRGRSVAEMDDPQDVEIEDTEAPPGVVGVPRLGDDMTTLLSLMQSDLPILRRVRCKKTSKAYYGFGDSSGLAFGATIQIKDKIWYEYGQWCSEVVEGSSSNWREFANLVAFLEGAIKEHELGGSEIFIFTDNSTSEAAFWKGTSRSRLLFDLVLRLKKLEMDYNLILHVIPVSGKRMIDQGSDGLPRADHTRGVVTGQDIRHWVPLNRGALQRSISLETWLGGVTRGMGFQTLEPEGWFTTGHGYGNYVWDPPPAAVEVVVEQLGKARMKRPEALHLIVVPRLMTGRWRRHLGRGTDGYFKIKDCPDTWDLSVQFEPILIFVCMPYVSSNPRLVKRKQLFDEFQGALPGKDMPEISAGRRGNLLRKLLESAWEIFPL